MTRPRVVTAFFLAFAALFTGVMAEELDSDLVGVVVAAACVGILAIVIVAFMVYCCVRRQSEWDRNSVLGRKDSRGSASTSVTPRWAPTMVPTPVSAMPVYSVPEPYIYAVPPHNYYLGGYTPKFIDAERLQYVRHHHHRAVYEDDPNRSPSLHLEQASQPNGHVHDFSASSVNYRDRTKRSDRDKAKASSDKKEKKKEKREKKKEKKEKKKEKKEKKKKTKLETEKSPESEQLDKMASSAPEASTSKIDKASESSSSESSSSSDSEKEIKKPSSKFEDQKSHGRKTSRKSSDSDKKPSSKSEDRKSSGRKTSRNADDPKFLEPDSAKKKNDDKLQGKHGNGDERSTLKEQGETSTKTDKRKLSEQQHTERRKSSVQLSSKSFKSEDKSPSHSARSKQRNHGRENDGADDDKSLTASSIGGNQTKRGSDAGRKKNAGFLTTDYDDDNDVDDRRNSLTVGKVNNKKKPTRGDSPGKYFTHTAGAESPSKTPDREKVKKKVPPAVAPKKHPVVASTSAWSAAEEDNDFELKKKKIGELTRKKKAAQEAKKRAEMDKKRKNQQGGADNTLRPQDADIWDASFNSGGSSQYLDGSDASGYDLEAADDSMQMADEDY